MRSRIGGESFLKKNLRQGEGRALLFGSQGAIGSAILATFERQGWGVVSVSHVADSRLRLSVEDEGWASGLKESGYLFNAVVWAQGINLNNSLINFDAVAHERVMRANLDFVIDTMSRILNSNILAPNARFTVLSSIWATLARSQKMSYMVSKAGLHALVRSASTDLAPIGIAVNSVSPGLIDSPMTRNFVSKVSLKRIAEESNGGKLATLEEIANVVCWLSGPSASGLSGQDLIVDRGWGTFKNVEP